MREEPPDRLATLYRVSQAFNSTLDLGEVLNRVMDETIAVTRAERGFLMLREADGSLGFRVARGMDQKTIDAPEFEVSRGVVERVAREGTPTLTSDAQSDSWLGSRTSVRALGLRAVLCVPMQVKGTTIGVIYVDNRLQAGIFSPGDIELLTGIAANAAIAIDNARLYLIAVEKGRLERELQVAREVQASLIPRDTPHIPGWEFAALWHPAREVSGDFYDFIPCSATRLAVVIADVADKGMPAALFMANTRSLIRSIVSHPTPPAEALAAANRLLFADASGGMFVTLCLVQLDPGTGAVEYVNAGHNPPLYYRSNAGMLTPLERTAMPLGIDLEQAFAQGALALEPGDFILLYTDGVTEATNAAMEEFGIERLVRVVESNRQNRARELLAALEAELGDFVGASLPADDVTVAIVRRC
jgi:sigma-B regulation protein RsbU (phosphoserine phosphatase)